MNIFSRLHVSAQMAHVIRLALIVIVVSPIVVYAAYTNLRPLTNGKINQGYLYGEEDPGHKGIDFPASNGTEVKVIANGTVMAFPSCQFTRLVKSFAATVVYDDACLGASFLGSALVTADQPLVGMANEASQDGRFKKAYSSFQGGSQTLTWYNTNGTQSGNPTSATINPRGSKDFSPPLENFKGSVVITANQPIAAVVNVVNNATSGDTHAVYNASNR